MAFTNSSVPNGWTLPLADEMNFPNNYSPDDSKGYSFCKVSLAQSDDQSGKGESGQRILKLISKFNKMI